MEFSKRNGKWYMVRTLSSFEKIFQCKCKTVKAETGKEITDKNILELE